MKYAFLFLLIWLNHADAQSDSTVSVKELGWTFQLPPGYKVIDTATLYAESRRDAADIHWIKKPPAGPHYDTTIFWARDADGQVFFVRFAAVKHDKQGLAIPVHKYLTVSESTESDVTYGGVKFHRRRTVVNAGLMSYIMFELKTPYDRKIFKINYTVPGPDMEQQFEKMLEGSKFER